MTMHTVKSAPRRTTAPEIQPAINESRIGPVSSIRIPTSAFTLAGFRAWAHSEQFPELGRIAFLGEEIFIDMSPERLDSHNAVKTEITRVVATLNVEQDLGKFYSDRTRLVHPASGLSDEPDGTFALWKSFETGKIRQVPSETKEGDYIELEGTPDWVMEIISPSSIVKDTKQLRKLYHQAGVSEFWLIDARGEEIDFQILIHGSKGYRSTTSRDGWWKSHVFGCWFRLERQRDRLGQWQYRLRMKPLM